MQTEKAIGEVIGAFTAQIGEKTVKIPLTSNKNIVFEGEKLRRIEGYAFSEYEGAMLKDIRQTNDHTYVIYTTHGAITFAFEHSEYLTATVEEEIKPEVVEIFKFPAIVGVANVSGYANDINTVIFQNAEKSKSQRFKENLNMKKHSCIDAVSLFPDNEIIQKLFVNGFWFNVSDAQEIWVESTEKAMKFLIENNLYFKVELNEVRFVKLTSKQTKLNEIIGKASAYVQFALRDTLDGSAPDWEFSGIVDITPQGFTDKKKGYVVFSYSIKNITCLPFGQTFVEFCPHHTEDYRYFDNDGGLKMQIFNAWPS